eukprot:scaffold291338_cov15-Tisochrysis_lutea.AAC.1
MHVRHKRTTSSFEISAFVGWYKHEFLSSPNIDIKVTLPYSTKPPGYADVKEQLDAKGCPGSHAREQGRKAQQGRA